MMLKKKNSKIKKSIDFTEESVKLLDDYKEINEVSSYSDIVNFLIETFLGLNKNVKKTLWRASDLELKDFTRKLNNELPYEREENRKIENQYMKLIRFFNDGKEVEVDQRMKRIDIEDGYVIFPDDWLVVYNHNPINSKYAGVVEVKNGTEYNAPHFLFFSEKPINQLTENDIELIDKECSVIFPKYKDILRDYVPLIFDKEHKPINLDEHITSPIPGYFAIQEYNRSPYSTYPCGAMIFRYKKNE
ncbi:MULTISPECIES: hypothetical protein [Clostridium]|uniref:hypothetical protein n=1 Tax=Clostridium TaxID=1485 RepID=UPI00290274C5|nr:hypothetical protein [Clostridium sp.]MDU1587022.1 hypothetical protein [Clostridium sp.]